MISIIIAAYNEENRITLSLFKIKDYMHNQGLDHEIIVVDDGSNDRTSEVVRGVTPDIPHLRVIRYEVNRGKGYALKTGVLASKGDVVLLSDADLSTPIEELSKLLPLIKDNSCEVVIGSRALILSDIVKKQPWWRQNMGKIFNKIVKFIVLDDFQDTQCGFKIFSGDIGRSLFRESVVERFAYDVEILARAKKKGYRIQEVPIRWINSPESRVNPLKDSFQMVFDLLKIRAKVGNVKGERVTRINSPLL
jgi:dolichyl-phosphate beta-glucosyltransferase